MEVRKLAGGNARRWGQWVGSFPGADRSDHR